jgi:hypothetical protein
MLPNPYVILGAVLFLLASVGGAFWLGDNHGTFVERAAQTQANLDQALKDLNDHKKNDLIAAKAGQGFENEKPQIITRVQYRDRDIIIPPDADPFVPVWFVRMFNDIASVEPPSDAYPGQPDSAPSRTRLSGTRAVLKAWAIKYETCRAQIDGIRELKPVLPTPADEKPSLFHQINPFN